MEYRGQAEQDRFVLNVLKFKKNGYFLEVGSWDAVWINNTFVLETEYDWRGIMVEYTQDFLSQYQKFRPNSIHVMDDARQVDYKKLFNDHNVPLDLDYLQIDLDVGNGSTLQALKKVNDEVMDKHRFATVTFEHDIYLSNHFDTRVESREIFDTRGYVRVFSDIKNDNNPYEDWYVHPSLVDMDYIYRLQELNDKKYSPHDSCGESIGWYELEYETPKL